MVLRKTVHQSLSGNIKKILKLKNNFPSLLFKKIEDIHRTIKNSDKTKPYINITTKDSFYKQIIISIGSDNSNVIVRECGQMDEETVERIKKKDF